MEQWMEMKGGGKLRLRQLEGRVQIEARRSDCADGLYKVWLTGEGAARCLLGTLAPSGGEYCLSRTVAIRELMSAGCWPVTGAEAVCAFLFSGQGAWRREMHPQRLIADQELRRQVTEPMLCQKCAEGFRLAMPFRCDRPMALTGLFCFARVDRIDGRAHLIWDFDGDGRPRFPYADGKSGENNPGKSCQTTTEVQDGENK